jgi:hypothetical protein
MEHKSKSITITFKFEAVFGSEYETDARLSFRPEQSSLVHVVEWKINQTAQIVLPMAKPCEWFGADLYATTPDEDGTDTKCRRFLAQASWQGQDMLSKQTISSVSMVKDHVKFRLTFTSVVDPHNLIKGSTHTQDHLYVLDEADTMVRKSNNVFKVGQDTFIYPQMNIFNTSYIDTILCGNIVHVPGWMDLLQLVKHSPRISDDFWIHSLQTAQRRLGLAKIDSPLQLLELASLAIKLVF